MLVSGAFRVGDPNPPYHVTFSSSVVGTAKPPQLAGGTSRPARDDPKGRFTKVLPFQCMGRQKAWRAVGGLANRNPQKGRGSRSSRQVDPSTKRRGSLGLGGSLEINPGVGGTRVPQLQGGFTESENHSPESIVHRLAEWMLTAVKSTKRHRGTFASLRIPRIQLARPRQATRTLCLPVVVGDVVGAAPST